jgi:hypothetical protein
MNIVSNWEKKSIMKKRKEKKLHDTIQQKQKLWLHFVLHIFNVYGANYYNPNLGFMIKSGECFLKNA